MPLHQDLIVSLNFFATLTELMPNQDQALVAQNILGEIDQKFVYCMVLMYDVLFETKGLSDELRSPKLDYLKAADLIESLIEELEEYRSEQKTTNYFEKSLGVETNSNLIGDVKMETRQAKRMLQRSGGGFETLEEFVKYLKPLEMAFCELLKAARITITLPVSTAGCERLFSKLKLIKNHLRTTIANARLKHLAVISIHRKRALSIDLEVVVDRFIQKFPNS